MLGDKRKLIEAAVLESNQNYREILISLKILKTWGLIHETFPQESVFDFMNRMNKRKNTAYSVLYSNQIYEQKGTYTNLKTPSQGCQSLRDKIVNTYKNNFKYKLGPNDRMNVPPVKLTLDRRKGITPMNHVRPYDTQYHLGKLWE